MEITTREKVLKNVRNAIISKTDVPYKNVEYESTVYVENATPYIDVVFAEEFTKVGGKFVYCENEKDLLSNLQALCTQYNFKNVYCVENEIKELLMLAKIPYEDEAASLLNAEVSIGFCESLIARFGSVLVSSGQASGRKGVVFAPIHVVIAYTTQIVMEINDAFKVLKCKYNNKQPSMLSVITGPSRTADIEKTLVMGAHGSKEIFVFLVENRQ